MGRCPTVLLGLFLLAMSVWGQPLDLSRLDALKTHRTTSRRFVVVGPRTLDNLEAGRWAETVAGRVQDLLGLPIPFRHREIRIVIRPSASATGTVSAAVCGPLALTQRVEAGRLVQRLVIPAADCLPEEPVRVAFCRLLLEGFFPSSRPTPQRPAAQPVAVPRWLSVGLARNLTRTQRAADARDVLAAWQAGRVPPLAEWLVKPPQAWDSLTDGPVASVWMAWLLEAPLGQARMRWLFNHLDQREAVSADDAAGELVGVASRADMEVAWDAWIMRQKRKVFRPGTVPPEAVERFAAELLLYPGGFGIPLASGIKRGDGFVALVAQREAEWIDGFCRTKLTALRVLAVGRGSAFHRTVDCYAQFLDALARHKRPDRLRELLGAAEVQMRQLKAAARTPAPDPMNEAEHDNRGAENIGG